MITRRLRQPLLVVTLCALVLPLSAERPPLADHSGVLRDGDCLLVVDDEEPGIYFRYHLGGARGPMIYLETLPVERVSLPRGDLAIDLESLERLADGRIVVLSERLRSLISAEGVVAEYEGTLGEIGRRGLEGVAVRRLENGSSRVAVLWEGGYPDLNQLPPALHQRVGGRAYRPRILVHDLKPGESPGRIYTHGALRFFELEVPRPRGREPRAQRFRAADLVWALPSGSQDGEGFIVLLSSQSLTPRMEFHYHWLQRFTAEGKPVGEPLDLNVLVPPQYLRINWEGLGWFEEGESLVLVHERNTPIPLVALVVELPESWRVAGAAGRLTHVIERETEYYLAGPQQGRPPDGKFAAGTRVRVLESAGSYARVRTENGVEAYVSSEALQPLAP
jgi:hypothetical protein